MTKKELLEGLEACKRRLASSEIALSLIVVNGEECEADEFLDEASAFITEFMTEEVTAPRPWWDRRARVALVWINVVGGSTQDQQQQAAYAAGAEFMWFNNQLIPVAPEAYRAWQAEQQHQTDLWRWLRQER
jgi:hypothetical protein